jgi:hypothetical protein
LPPNYLVVLLSCCALLLTDCANVRDKESNVGTEHVELNGPALYAKYCARCHRPLEKTTKAQRSASRLRSANRQFPAMTNLDFLTDDQLEAIANALKTIPIDIPQHDSRR